MELNDLIKQTEEQLEHTKVEKLKYIETQNYEGAAKFREDEKELLGKLDELKSYQLLLKYGREGGDSALYSFSDLNEKTKYILYTDAWGLDDNDDETYYQNEKTYSSFDEFLIKFISGSDKWFMFFPLYIDESLKSKIKEELQKINNSDKKEYYSLILNWIELNEKN